MRVAFLGCGFITRVHSRHLTALKSDVVCSYASRDRSKADEYRRRYQGAESYAGYTAAIDDPRVEAVVIAVPPRFHLDLTLQALKAGKHVLVEKPAFVRLADYQAVADARDHANRVVLVGENDHYKPLAARSASCWRKARSARWCSRSSRPSPKGSKTAGDWRNDEAMAGGDAFFEEGIHWLHLAGSLGPTITTIQGYRPSVSPNGPDTRAKSMMVAFRYDNDAVGSLYYSREIPSLLHAPDCRNLFGLKGVIIARAERLFVLVSRPTDRRAPFFPDFRDIPRGYQGDVSRLSRIHQGRTRARDEPRAGHRRPAAHGPALIYDIVIIGSGAGGGTAAILLAGQSFF